MTKPRKSNELIRRAQEGDRKAFGIITERYRPRLEALVRLRLGPRLRKRIEVADVLQEVFLRAFVALDSFTWRHEGSLYHWLGGITEHVIKGLARHHLQTLKRDADREVALPVDELDGTATEGSPLRDLRRSERFDRLERALGRLAKDHREVIILARLRGLSTGEIARRMNRTPEAVSMLLLRALRALKAAFGERTDSFSLPRKTLDPPRPPEDPRPPGSGNGVGGHRFNGGTFDRRGREP